MGQYLMFRVGRHDFVLDAARIRGLLPLRALLPLDSPHDWIRGAASLCGREFPVVDSCVKLGLPPSPRVRRPGIIAIELRGGRLIGFTAERLSRLIALRDGDLRGPMVSVGARLRNLFDPDRILSDEELELAGALRLERIS